MADIPANTIVINHDAPNMATKNMGDGKAIALVSKFGNLQCMKITFQPEFDWVRDVSPLLPDTPQRCPATHFGVLTQGQITISNPDGSSTVVNAGDTYLMPPGHVPKCTSKEPSVMVEFSDNTAAVLATMSKVK